MSDALLEPTEKPDDTDTDDTDEAKAKVLGGTENGDVSGASISAAVAPPEPVGINTPAWLSALLRADELSVTIDALLMAITPLLEDRVPLSMRPTIHAVLSAQLAYERARRSA